MTCVIPLLSTWRQTGTIRSNGRSRAVALLLSGLDARLPRDSFRERLKLAGNHAPSQRKRHFWPREPHETSSLRSYAEPQEDFVPRVGAPAWSRGRVALAGVSLFG